MQSRRQQRSSQQQRQWQSRPRRQTRRHRKSAPRTTATPHTESEDALAGFEDKWSVAIDRMVEERKALKLEQRLKTKAIRKTIRQKRRTMKNAKKLTDDELSQIVLDRRILDLVEREAKAAGVKSSSSSATSTAST